MIQPAIVDERMLPPWVRWVGQDADGAWWGYEHEPNAADHGWYENEVGRSVKLGKAAPNPQWRATLRRARNGKP